MVGQPDVRVVQLRKEPITLGQLLKLVGLVDTGGGAKALLAEGQVRVDGVVERRRGRKLLRGQEVEVAGTRLRLE